MDMEIFSLADKIIDMLRMKKIAELPDLVKDSGGTEKDVRKVIDILERQGFVNVDYNLTRIRVAWNDTDGGKSKQTELVKKTPALSAHVEVPLDGRGEEIKEGSSAFETKLSRLRKKSGIKKKSTTVKIKPTVSETKPEVTETKPEIKPKIIKIKPKEVEKKIRVPVKEIKSVDVMKAELIPVSEKEIKPRTEDELKAKLIDIKKIRSELSGLHAEKEALTGDYSKISSRFDSEFGRIVETISQTGDKVQKLQDTVRAFPEKIGDITINTLELRKTGIETKDRFKRALSTVDDTIAQLRETKKLVSDEIASARGILEGASVELNSLKEKLDKSVNSEINPEETIETARKRIEDETYMLKQFEQSFTTIKDSISGLKTDIEKMNTGVEKGYRNIMDVEQKIRELGDLEKEIVKTKGKYSEALVKLETDLSKYDIELEEMRKDVEGSTLEKYKIKLERMDKDYKSDMAELAEREKQIDVGIESNKLELGERIEEARKFADEIQPLIPPKSTEPVKDTLKERSTTAARDKTPVEESRAIKIRVVEKKHETRFEETTKALDDAGQKKSDVLKKLSGFLSRMKKK